MAVTRRLCKYLLQFERRIDVTALMQFVTHSITKLDSIIRTTEAFHFLIVKQISIFYFIQLIQIFF